MSQRLSAFICMIFNISVCLSICLFVSYSFLIVKKMSLLWTVFPYVSMNFVFRYLNMFTKASCLSGQVCLSMSPEVTFIFFIVSKTVTMWIVNFLGLWTWNFSNWLKSQSGSATTIAIRLFFCSQVLFFNINFQILVTI